MDLTCLTAHKLLELLDNKEITVEEILDALFERIERLQPKLSAFASFDKKEAISRWQKNKERIKDKRLFGIPILIKDNICVKDELTTCASRILKDFKPPYNATVIDRLEASGAILLGKANMDEFAFGSSTESSAYYITRNPWDLDRVPGGSSGGSACAVASHQTILALGSDTGGSIRQPASFCGAVGLKPTYGRVSRYGLIAFASSLDQIGPITKDVEDAAILLSVISGYDPKDSTSAQIPVPDYRKIIKEPVKGMKIGIPKEYFQEGIDKEVELSIKEAINKFKDLGAICEEISLPHTEYAVSVYYLVATAEASSNLARYDGVQYGYRAPSPSAPQPPSPLLDMYKRTRAEGFGAEAKRRILLGTFALSSGYYDAYYLRALKVRTLIKQDFDEAFERFDCILTPTSPTAAFKIGEKIEDPLTMYLSDIFTISVNLAGIPGVSIPCGFTKEKLPIGLQILGKPFDEATILKAAYNFEQATEYHLRSPSL